MCLCINGKKNFKKIENTFLTASHTIELKRVPQGDILIKLMPIYI